MNLYEFILIQIILIQIIFNFNFLFLIKNFILINNKYKYNYFT